MSERKVPESIKERLRRRLEESVGKKGRLDISGRKARLAENLRERLRAKILESKDSVRERLRAKLRERLMESRRGLRGEIRNRMGMRLFEGSSGLRKCIRGRLLESRGDLRDILRERIRRRLIERRVGGSLVRHRLAGDVDRSRIREKTRERLLEGRSAIRSMRGEVRSRVVGDRIGLGERKLVGLRRNTLRERLPRLSDKGIILERSGMVEAFLRRRVERLEKELERKRRLLKEAYKVVRKVEELGGINKVEEAMRLAYDTLIKAGSKAFKEAVEGLARETGVDRKEVAAVVKKVGLKEAREILKGGKRGKAGSKTIIVEGMGEKEEQVSALAMRVVERLSKQVGVENPSDARDLSEAVFRK